MVGILVIAALAVIVGLWLMSIYNGLIRGRNFYKNSFAQIDVQLKRRYELIPNLVETAKAYLKHERETLEAVIAARNQAFSAAKAVAANPADPQLMQSLMSAEGSLGASLSKLMVSVEAYPELKANSTMAQLMEELTSTENKISFARQAYNDAVMTYNNSREVFPSNFFSTMWGFQAATLFEVDTPAERQGVKVQF